MKKQIFVFLLLLAGCGGTGVGNPGLVVPTSISGPSANYASENILESVCTLLVSCSGGLTLENCLSGVQSASAIDVTLGLPAGHYSNYYAVEAADEAGAIQSNEAAANQCEAQIAALSCSSSAVQAAYQPAAVNPFANVAGMMPTAPGSCGSVF